ncbi:MAG TPA: beta-propeller fold lactonase family protein, partial [Chloroflexota bacterium]|nr:beta-propeller fold lactonase family protein [Chloroflexota bacterium]
SRDGKEVVVSGFGSNEEEIIDTASDQVVATFPVNAPHNSAITPDGRFAYVGSQQKDATAVVVLDLTGKTQVTSVPVPNQPRALNFSPDGKQLYFTLVGSDAVQVLDPATNKLLPEIAVGAAPHHPIFTPDGKLALVVAQGPGELDIIDPTKGAEAGTVKVGTFPHWIGLSSEGKVAYVSNEGSNDVSLVDLGMRMVMGTISVGNAPRKIALQPGSIGSSPAPAGAAGGSGGSASPGSGSGQPLKLGNVSYADHGTKDASGATTIAIEADDFYFNPTFVRAAPGQKLTLDITSKSGTLHNFSMAGQIDKDIPPYGSISVDVTIPQSGVLPFTCKYHTALGMNGQLLSGSAAPQAI